MTESSSDPWRGRQPVAPAPPPTPASASDPTSTETTAEHTTGWLSSRWGWWARLNPAPRALMVIAAAALPILVCCGGFVFAGALVDDRPDGDAGAASASAADTPTAGPTVTVSPSPVVEIRTVTETEKIPFDEKTVEDPSLLEGTEQVRSEGSPGELTLTYEVTLVNGVEVERELVKEEVTEEPEDRVVAIGTYVEPPPAPPPDEQSGCDPNYAGACVPIDSDVDCAGGSGDGPSYVQGPVRVIGQDIYGLDRDGDGIGCD